MSNELPTSAQSRHRNHRCGLGHLRVENLANGAGARSYYLGGPLAWLEAGLVRLAIDRLLASGFRLVGVPDLVPAGVIDATGFQTTGERNQVCT
ncbi:unnamed protein product [Protopolystoma xenopodis]|uniref:Uncharacterized protein n=1 Tax=Protopolystoma xenopodis TaxID=117903 RepID=A0A448X628_9PLAT|nr:unnamed protein product [Protopolystoma xenopodis]